MPVSCNQGSINQVHQGVVSQVCEVHTDTSGCSSSKLPNQLKNVDQTLNDQAYWFGQCHPGSDCQQ